MAETLRERIEKGEFENRAPSPHSQKDLRKDTEYLKLLKEEKQLSSRLVDIESEMCSIRRLMHSVQRGEEASRRECFRQALETEFGTSDHPKRDQLWDRAYDAGHSNGWTEIFGEYEDLVELIL